MVLGYLRKSEDEYAARWIVRWHNEETGADWDSWFCKIVDEDNRIQFHQLDESALEQTLSEVSDKWE